MVSLFFNGTAATNNPYFDFQSIAMNTTGKTIDIGSMIPRDTAMSSWISGYIGSDTMPDCKEGWCIYLMETINLISADQLAWIKNDTVEFNNRDVMWVEGQGSLIVNYQGMFAA